MITSVGGKGMRGIFVLVALTSVVFGSGVARAGDDVHHTSHRLLAVQGQNLKWGQPSPGTPAVIRYAFADAPVARPEARNCKAMQALPARMNKGGPSFDAVASEIHRAFETWEKVANVSFVYVTDVAEADVLVGAQQVPKGIAFADVNYRTSSSASMASIRKAAICFNPEVLWETAFDQDESTYDMRYVAMHEIGHVLGLNHALGKTNSIMGFRYRESVRAPQAGDIAGVTVLYGPKVTRAAAMQAQPVRY